MDWMLAKNMEARMRRALDPLLSDNAEHTGSGDADDSEAQTHARSKTEGASLRNARKHHKWTRVHSHYALMGGYVLDMSKLPINFAPNQVTRLTLTPDAVLELAEQEPYLLPDISGEEIQDKSKADGFTKTFVCIQALWFLAQIIGRLATHQPIGLLEMNTLLHALCCLIVYAAWWHKPLDIEEPTLIDAAGGPTVCAHMITRSHIGFKRTFHDPPNQDIQAAAVKLWHDDVRPNKATVIDQTDHGDQHITDQAHIGLENGSEITAKAGQKHEQTNNNKSPPASLKGWVPESEVLNSMRLYSHERFCSYYFRSESSVGRHYIYLTRGDAECLRLAQRYERRLKWPIVFTKLQYQAPPFYHQRIKTAVNGRPDSLRTTLICWVGPGGRFRTEALDFMYIAGILACNSVYGGVHLLAWRSHFPSIAEKYLWRTACFIIVFPFPITLLVCFGSQLLVELLVLRSNEDLEYPLLSHDRKGSARRKARKIFLNRYIVKPAAWVIGTVVVVSYIAARIYLVAESFRNLGYMPVEVYKEPEWSKYIPRFGAG
jgi:hypothetical protein